MFCGCHCIFLFIIGPLVMNVNGKATLVGIVSWGTDKIECPAKYPVVFANVAKYTHWIHEKMMTDLP